MNDKWHKEQYRQAVEVLRHAGNACPEWEDLTKEQRARIRETNNAHKRYMERLSKAVRGECPLPNPFEDI